VILDLRDDIGVLIGRNTGKNSFAGASRHDQPRQVHEKFLVTSQSLLRSGVHNVLGEFPDSHK